MKSLFFGGGRDVIHFLKLSTSKIHVLSILYSYLNSLLLEAICSKEVAGEKEGSSENREEVGLQQYILCVVVTNRIYLDLSVPTRYFAQHQ